MNHVKIQQHVLSRTFYVLQTSHKNYGLLYMPHITVCNLSETNDIYNFVFFPVLNHISIVLSEQCHQKPFVFLLNGCVLCPSDVWQYHVTSDACLIVFFSSSAFRPTFQDISEMQVILRVNQNFTRHLRNCPVLTLGWLRLIFSGGMQLSFTHLQADSSSANKYSYMSFWFSSRRLVYS